MARPGKGSIRECVAVRIEFTKQMTADLVAVTRQDGTSARTPFPHKGPVPHDAVHFFVELELGMTDGFWGLVARGYHPEEIGAIAKAAGHASAARRTSPDESFVQAIQAERLVECFEADLWSDGCDPRTFMTVADAACEDSLVPRVPIRPEQIDRIRVQIASFRDEWSELPLGKSHTLEWPEN